MVAKVEGDCTEDGGQEVADSDWINYLQNQTQNYGTAADKHRRGVQIRHENEPAIHQIHSGHQSPDVDGQNNEGEPKRGSSQGVGPTQECQTSQKKHCHIEDAALNKRLEVVIVGFELDSLCFREIQISNVSSI